MIDAPPLARLGILLLRPGMLVVATPVFGGPFVPAPVKIGLTVILAVTLMPFVVFPETTQATALAGIAIREVAVGLALAMSVRIVTAAAELAGYLAGFQLGFSYAAIVDPQSGVRNNVVSSLYATLATVVFFGLNGHHTLIQGLAASYTRVPAGLAGIDGAVPDLVASMLGSVFATGAQLAAPVVVALVLTELALGLMSRVAPALNLMVIGFPVRLIVGLTALAAAIQIVPFVVSRVTPPAFELAARLMMAFR